MYTENQTKEMFKTVFDAIGIRTREFTVDYRDDFNNYYHVDTRTAASQGISDECLAGSLINELEVKGFTVYSIYERFNGYSTEEIDKIAKRNPLEAAKHIKPIYLNLNKERT